MKDSQRQQTYKILLEDDTFFRWLLCPDREIDSYWQQIMQDNPETKQAADELRQIIQHLGVRETHLSEDDKRELWTRIETDYRRKRSRKRRHTFLRYAAAFGLLIAAGITVWYYSSGSSTDYRSIASDINLPGDRQAHVTVIRPNAEKIEIEASGAELRYDAEGRLSAGPKTVETAASADTASLLSAVAPEDGPDCLIVPYGKTTRLVLSDGTLIWVNSGSKLIYSSVFSGNKREIYVEGEVYLEVMPGKAPFIVKTDKLDILVHGTSFNVSAYKDDETQSVALATGSVTVATGRGKKLETLRKNQLFSFAGKTGVFEVSEVDVLDHISWKYGFISYKNERLGEVIKKLERYYNVRILFEKEAVDETTVSGKLDLKENISETFRSISRTAPVVFEAKDERTYEIKINP
ncbi:MAG: FecR domain-containing protein [Tannerella sp.]|jgi:ferric-dicitrate binding protein FerR (iron transport regulator)|nr:FecR domain-containing protein [Tannerella sp.]